MPGLRPSLSEIRGLSNFSQQFRWGIEVVKPPNVAPIDTTSLNLRAISTSVPNSNPTKTEIQIRGHKIFENGIMDWVNTIDLTLIETNDAVVARWLSAWRQGCWDRTGGVTGVTQDKVNLEAILAMHRLDNLDVPVATYVLFGVLLENVTYGDLVADSADAIRPVLTLSYDWFEETIL